VNLNRLAATPRGRAALLAAGAAIVAVDVAALGWTWRLLHTPTPLHRLAVAAVVVNALFMGQCTLLALAIRRSL
jgi:hypothetical protein